MARVKYNFNDIDTFFEEGKKSVLNVVDKVGKESVQHAIEAGTYQNRTGTLRASNKHEVHIDGLLLKNEAKSPEGNEYASHVEAKGYDVLSSSALYAEKRLREEIG